MNKFRKVFLSICIATPPLLSSIQNDYGENMNKTLLSGKFFKRITQGPNIFLRCGPAGAEADSPVGIADAFHFREAEFLCQLLQTLVGENGENLVGNAGNQM